MIVGRDLEEDFEKEFEEVECEIRVVVVMSGSGDGNAGYVDGVGLWEVVYSPAVVGFSSRA